MADLWRKSLHTLRRQFEEASFRHPELNLTLVDVDDDQRDTAEGPPVGF